MWNTKLFKITKGDSSKAHKRMVAWIAKNESRYQIVEIFVNNAYAVQYKKLVRL